MTHAEKFIYWIPRFLGIVFVIFLSLFSLDVFSEYSGYEVILPLFMHLLPSLILTMVVIIAWKYEWVGAVVFLGFAVFYVWDVGFDRPFGWYLAIAVPASVIGIFFFISWMLKKSRHKTAK